MAGAVRHAKLDSRSARARLKRGRQPHWWPLVTGKVHLGWQCKKGHPQGRWVLRRYVGGKYRVLALGLADDAAEANGTDVLSYEQAMAKAQSAVNMPAAVIQRLTVRQALDRYIEHLTAEGKSTSDTRSRGNAHIKPTLGDLVVAEITREQLRNWLAKIAAAPAQRRPKGGKATVAPAPETDEQKRRRRNSANRVLNILKAALNYAFEEGHVANRDAWGRALKPLRNAGAARVRFLSMAEATRLLNASSTEFRPLVRAALETGARWGELTKLEVRDFHPDRGTVFVAQSKSGKSRHIIMTPEGAAFFAQHCAGRAGSEVMFQHAQGGAWKRSEQARPMRQACDNGRVTPACGFHQLRHTWASHAVMNGVPLMVVARNLGHSDTRMTEKHYAHLQRDYVTEAIHANAPRFGDREQRQVVRFQGREIR